MDKNKLPHFCQIENKEVWVTQGESCPNNCNYHDLSLQSRDGMMDQCKSLFIHQYEVFYGWRGNERTIEGMRKIPEYVDPEGHLIWNSDEPVFVENMDLVRVEILKDAPRNECILLLKKILECVEGNTLPLIGHDFGYTIING